MSLYAISDLHLSFGVPEKTMSIFRGWENYHERIRKNWLELVKPDDTVVIAGDFCWGMNLKESFADFEFLNSLTGNKILVKGNHDYWWTTQNKIKNFFDENNFSTLNILHINHYKYENYGICGTRGWINMPDEPADAKILAREAGRLEASILSAISENLEPVVFMHYPPIFGGSFNYDILDVLYKYKIKRCFYGHIHGKGHASAVQGVYDGIDFRLISGDFLQFIPQKVL
ncbi:MAG: metallophosphoesterase [Oscillospiraceae bacterium]|nr:metallophosphoesterase [Oscillospiraceae bacterium]